MISRLSVCKCLKMTRKGMQTFPVHGDSYFIFASIYGDPASIYPLYLHVIGLYRADQSFTPHVVLMISVHVK